MGRYPALKRRVAVKGPCGTIWTRFTMGAPHPSVARVFNAWPPVIGCITTRHFVPYVKEHGGRWPDFRPGSLPTPLTLPQIDIL
jgi:hypothetical protein